MLPPASAKPAGAETLIASQQTLAGQAVRALGLPVWPSGRYQADELISTAAARRRTEAGVDQVVICATDNDFMQCVVGTSVVVLDRIRRRVTDEAGVVERFGVMPAHTRSFPPSSAIGRRLAGRARWGRPLGRGRAGSVWAAGGDPVGSVALDVPVRGRDAVGHRAAGALGRGGALP